MQSEKTKRYRYTPSLSNVDAFGDFKRVVYFDTEISHGTFDFGVSQ